jgi:hypothetical protein
MAGFLFLVILQKALGLVIKEPPKYVSFLIAFVYLLFIYLTVQRISHLRGREGLHIKGFTLVFSFLTSLAIIAGLYLYYRGALELTEEITSKSSAHVLALLLFWISGLVLTFGLGLMSASFDDEVSFNPFRSRPLSSTDEEDL